MALRDQPYIPLYVMDFMTDERLAECSAESTGVYIRLMCVMHKSKEYGTILLKQKDKQNSEICLSKNESKIRDFALKLARQMPYDAECIERALTELIDEEVIILDGDRLYQKRMVRDNALSEKRADAGKKGGKTAQKAPSEVEMKQNSEICLSKNESKTSSKMPSKIEANSENEIEYEIEYENEYKNEYENDYENDYENESEATQKKSDSRINSHINNSPELSADNVTDVLAADRFERFWQSYPRKAGKGAAEKAWKKIAPNRELFNRIMAALESVKSCDQWKKDNGQFIPYPATWLNQRRWEDDCGAAEPDSSFDPDNPYADWAALPEGRA